MPAVDGPLSAMVDETGRRAVGARTTGSGRWRALRSGRAVGFVVVAAAALCPLYLSEFKVGLIGLGLTYGLFAIALDLAWGRTGIVSVGHAVFFGLGV